MQVRIKEGEINLPDFLLVGAAKSGTTSLYQYLKQHPQIYMSENKEPWFFSFADIYKEDVHNFSGKGDIVTDFMKYVNLFSGATNEQVVGEASTVYLYLYEETIKNIKKYHPNWKELKIIIIIRDPSERAFSHYLNSVGDGSCNSSFEEEIEKWNITQCSDLWNIIDYGFYYNQIKSYKDTFGQVKIYLFDDLEERSALLAQDLYRFLEVDTFFKPNTDLKYNVSGNSGKFLRKLIYKPNLIKKVVKTFLPIEARTKIKNNILGKFAYKSNLENAQKKILKEIYKEDITKLQDLIDKDLTRWLRRN